MADRSSRHEKFGETAEEYEQRLAKVRAVHIFGDVDTTAGVFADETDVPSSDNEAAQAAVAEAQAEEEDVSKDEARRQVDVSAGVPSSDEEEEEESQEEEEEEEEEAQSQKASDKVQAIQSAESTEEVDQIVGNDERSTVVKAADKRRSELS